MEPIEYARLFSWAVAQIPASFASSKKRAYCMMANIRNLADLIDKHERKAKIALLATTEANFVRLFDSLAVVALAAIEDELLQMAAFGAASSGAIYLLG